MSVLIIDYGMGNLGSVRRAFEECGADVFVSDQANEVSDSDALVLPGVGAFGEGMKNLNEMGWSDAIYEHVRQKKPFLGICLGMQLLAEKGFEGGEREGLGLIPGEVRQLELSPSFRIPHIGWNEVRACQESELLEHIPNETDFYFVHSFSFRPKDEESVLARTPYDKDFVSIVQKNGHIFGTQFHPEKSQRPGFQLIKNFLGKICC